MKVAGLPSPDTCSAAPLPGEVISALSIAAIICREILLESTGKLLPGSVFRMSLMTDVTGASLAPVPKPLLGDSAVEAFACNCGTIGDCGCIWCRLRCALMRYTVG